MPGLRTRSTDSDWGCHHAGKGGLWPARQETQTKRCVPNRRGFSKPAALIPAFAVPWFLYITEGSTTSTLQTLHIIRDQTPWEGRQFGLTNPSPSRRLRQPRGRLPATVVGRDDPLSGIYVPTENLPEDTVPPSLATSPVYREPSRRSILGARVRSARTRSLWCRRKRIRRNHPGR
jgi:hypothetical protein